MLELRYVDVPVHDSALLVEQEYRRNTLHAEALRELAGSVVAVAREVLRPSYVFPRQQRGQLFLVGRLVQ